VPKIEQSFEVEQPVKVVWDFFQDVPQVAECMPGVELTEKGADDVYKGKMKIKLGPISAQFQGEARIQDLDETAHTGTISAKGADQKGGSRASATVKYALAGDGGSTKVDISADIHLQGSMAQFGRSGLIQDVSGQLTREFAGCLGQKLMASTPEEAAEVKAGEVKGFSLFFSTLWARIRRLFGGSKDRG
jgi:carbon monoxide dehydrogenase subunit G